ncbi:MFS transporter [Haloplanus halobius]|uniref:MFS transporter n=1 Tax=Haloplanus halobius TaxID=2934938 RepID=UPI00200E7F8E
MVVAAAIFGVSGTYQFVWSTIRPELGIRIGASEAGVGTVFTLFIIAQVLSQFPAGWIRDRFGPRLPLLVGGIGLGAGYIGLAQAGSVFEAYLFYTAGGIGSGMVYVVAINTPVKWFDKRRGLATGIVGLMYGGLSVVLIPYIRRGVVTGFENTVSMLGVGAGVTCLLAVLILRDPREEESTSENTSEPPVDDSDNRPKTPESTADLDSFTWSEMIRTWQFWLLYLVFIVVNGVGLMLISKIVGFASGIGLSTTTGVRAASLIALADGLGIVVGGWFSDYLGRERTTMITLTMCGISLAGSVLVGWMGHSELFVVLVAVAAFFRSPVFAIFPALIGEYYGLSRSSQNYAALFSGKLWGGVIGGTVASVLIVSFGWLLVFLTGAVLLITSGIATYFLHPIST